MPISCHFRDCKALLVASLTHVSGDISSVQTFIFTFSLTSTVKLYLVLGKYVARLTGQQVSKKVKCSENWCILTRGAILNKVRDVMFPPKSAVALQFPRDVTMCDVTMCDVTPTTAYDRVTAGSALEPRVIRYRRIRTIDYC